MEVKENTHQMAYCKQMASENEKKVAACVAFWYVHCI